MDVVQGSTRDFVWFDETFTSVSCRSRGSVSLSLARCSFVYRRGSGSRLFRPLVAIELDLIGASGVLRPTRDCQLHGTKTSWIRTVQKRPCSVHQLARHPLPFPVRSDHREARHPLPFPVRSDHRETRHPLPFPVRSDHREARHPLPFPSARNTGGHSGPGPRQRPTLAGIQRKCYEGKGGASHNGTRRMASTTCRC